MSYGMLVQHDDYPLGYIQGLGPACPPDTRCAACDRWAAVECQTCHIGLCAVCWWRHSHEDLTRKAAIFCACPAPADLSRCTFHEAYVVARWSRGNRRVAADVCGRCRKVVKGSAQYLEPTP